MPIDRTELPFAAPWTAIHMPRLALLLALAGASPAAADPIQYVDVVIEKPDGWAGMLEGSNERRGYRYFSRPFEKTCEDCLLFLTAGEPAPADLARFAEQSARRFLLPDDPSLQPGTAPEAGDFGAMRLAVGSWSLGDDILFIAPVQQGDKVTVIGFRGPAGTPEALVESSETFQTTLMTALGGLRFTPPGKPVMPPPQPGPLDGPYWGSVTRSTLGMDGMLQMDIQGRTFVFWREGWFHDGAPDNGLAPPTPAELIPGGPEGDGDWGTYRIEGKTIRVTYIGGGTESFRLSALGGTIYDGDREMFHVDPLQDGERISGSVSTSFYSGFNDVIASGGAAARSYTIFNLDGTYETGGWSTTTANIKGSGIVDPPNIGGVGAHSTNDGTTGRYEIEGGVIRYFPKDGSRGGVALIFRVGEDSIFIGTQPLK